ncbi:MAG: hypothetical protein BHW21_08510 [Eubacterium sp. 45_250]|nr:MAG: hypothetical protein BHW21_08510 [Eubacterium sp. 45_250]
MANLYVADDGTIHDRDTEHHERVNTTSSVSSSNTYATPYVSGGRKAAFWVVTISLALLIGYILYSTIGVQIFERVSNPNELIEYLENFFCIIAPFAIVGGAVTGAIIYGTKCARAHGYNLGTYFLSALSAAGGTVGVGISLFLLVFIITIVLYILLIAIIIAIIAAILGGN